MTLERAAELVNKLMQVDKDAAIDLFVHFDDYFKLSPNEKRTTQFAELCGYAIAHNVRLLEEN